LTESPFPTKITITDGVIQVHSPYLNVTDSISHKRLVSRPNLLVATQPFASQGLFCYDRVDELGCMHGARREERAALDNLGKEDLLAVNQKREAEQGGTPCPQS
jgi:hypothetical protein